ncbi:DUF262 domain-containing protein [Chelatococcus sambhunathii]|uniref:DUF262 domain-containing protein n=1 Tax=Chelatococcus sambhunathii TaxID=363953 RepID=A0ABU1DEP8_9HYPH|nr:DUF262 domain-containing protein [Chelatococcus sambhunathii]MDR4306557.1 DUF262 domain-containing protein [Chelatococcus sambhunathii]
MAVSPQGMSIQALYRAYRDGTLIVNRQYQRKLVWQIFEKQKLIDSILKDYPLPLFLLAEKAGSPVIWEVIDGMQRLNAIFSFIENGFLLDGQCFDVKEFARARQAAESGVFKEYEDDVPRLSAKLCADLQDYQLAVTVFPGEHPERITDVFGRINAGGKQLSDQERRQAGVLSPFAEVVRTLSAEIRGDVSRDTLLLSEMPEISIETSRNPHGYALKAEDIFWCYQGILRSGDLRDSDDEQAIADICASILFEEPVEASGEYLNKLYSKDTDEYKDLNARLSAYGRDRLVDEVKSTFSTIRSVIEAHNTARFTFRTTVYPKPTSNAQKSPFYAVFMAFFDLMHRQSMRPAVDAPIMKALENLSNSIEVGQKHIKTEDRRKNINITKGLIQDHFVKVDVATLAHGPGLIFDFENSIRRARTETARYEFKQGLLELDGNFKVGATIVNTIIETVCGIANVGPDADGFLYVGIADKPEDAARIEALYGVVALKFDHVSIVGIDREAKHTGVELDKFVRIIEDGIRNSGLTDPLKTQVLSSIDVVNYKGYSVVRIRVPKQSSPSFVGDDCFLRAGSSTIKAKGPQIAAITASFGKAGQSGL